MTEQQENRSRPPAPTTGGEGAWSWDGENWSLTIDGLDPRRVKPSRFEQHIMDLNTQAGLNESHFFDGAGRPILQWYGSVNGKNVSALYEQGAARRESMIARNRIEVTDYDYMRFLVGKAGAGLLLFGLHMHQFPEQSSIDPKVQSYVKAFLPTFGLYPYLDSDDATMHLSEEGQGRRLRQLTVDDLLGDWLQKERQTVINNEERARGRSVVTALLENFEVDSPNDLAWKGANPYGMAMLREGAVVMRRDFSGRYSQGDRSREARAGMWQRPVINRPPPIA